MDRSDKRDKKSGGSGLGYLIAAGVGLLAGFIANEFMSK